MGSSCCAKFSFPSFFLFLALFDFSRWIISLWPWNKIDYPKIYVSIFTTEFLVFIWYDRHNLKIISKCWKHLWSIISLTIFQMISKKVDKLFKLRNSNSCNNILEISNTLETCELQVYATKVKTLCLSSTILCLRVLIKIWLKLGTSDICWDTILWIYISWKTENNYFILKEVSFSNSPRVDC